MFVTIGIKGVVICFMKRALGDRPAKKVLRKANKQYEEYLRENKIYPTQYNLYFDNHIEHVTEINKEDNNVDQT